MGCYLITGANRGIGLELARQLKARGDEVIAACRKSTTELDGLGVRVETGIDVCDDAVLAGLAGKLGDVKLDCLINNAGILERTSFPELDVESLHRQFEINAVGPLQVTRALLGHLRQGAKVALVTSLMGSMSDNSSGGHYGYRMSKAALNSAGVSLAHDLRPRGISVVILHPGMVQTEMTGYRGISAQESARGLLARIDALTPENTGTFWHADGRPLGW